jgi:adenylate cyclase
VNPHDELAAGLSVSEIRAYVSKLLDRDLALSKRGRGLLKFIVDKALAGRTDQLKGYTIAVEVFDRPVDFDSGSDPIVRLEAGRLRRALESYYSGPGADDPIRLDIPKGAYIPRFIRQSGFERPGSAPGASTIADEPTLAILPFISMGPDAHAAYIADGLTEELTSEFACYPALRVASRYQTRIYRDHPASLKDAALALGTRFLVGGTVHVAGDRVRIGAELSDALSGLQIWAQTFEGSWQTGSLLESLQGFAVQIVSCVAGFYGGAIQRELRKQRQGGPESLTPSDVLDLQNQFNKLATRENFDSAIRAAERVVVREPRSAAVWSSLAELLLDGYSTGYADTDEIPVAAVRSAIHKVRKLDPDWAYADWLDAYLGLVTRDRKLTERAAQALMTRSPTPPELIAFGAWSLALIGESERGTRVLREQLAKIHRYPSWLHHAFFLDHYQRRNYIAAMAEAEQFDAPGFFWDPLDKAAALGQLGEIDRAQEQVRQLVELNPDFVHKPRRYLSCFIFTDELVSHVLDGLLEAGLSTQADGAG